MPRVIFPLVNGIRLSNLGSFQDLLNMANIQWRKVHNSQDVAFQWYTASPDGEAITVATGISIQPDYALDDCPPADVVVIPACTYTNKQHWPDTLASYAPLYPWLRSRFRDNHLVLSHCTGVFLVAEAGLLNGKPATTAWWLEETFRARYPEIELAIEQLVVESGRLLTGAAGNSDQLLALKLITRYMGPQISSQVSKLLLVDINRMEQTPFLTLQQQMEHSDTLVADAQTWLQNNLREPAAVSHLPEALKVSARTLIRHFSNALGETPNRYLQNLRIDTAKRLLESGNQSVENVMSQVGYTDLSSFSRLFQRKTGLTPRAYRQRFHIRQQ